MNPMSTSGRKMKLMAGFVALAATLFSTAGTLALADHYARTAGDAQIRMAGNPAAAPALCRSGDDGRVADYS
jgi:hypothetical protein